jgi:hypothetical protein
MAHIANAKIVIIWEHELRVAARALEKLQQAKPKPTTEDFRQALHACFAAIYSPELASGAPVTVMSAQEALKNREE